MDKDIKIIIIGFGSIGQRHYKNLLKLGYKYIYVYDIDQKKIGDKINRIKKLTQKELGQFKVAFICNPTHLHIKTALQCGRAKCHMFIEKSLSNNLKDVNKLIRLCKKNKLITMVACNMRFNPCLGKIKSLVDRNFVGRIYAIYLEYGRYLPYQRLKADYKKTYAANKKMGGGIILDDIHDFDLLFWFNNFKKVNRVSLTFDKISDLKINVEDICITTLVFDNKVIGNIRCDYLQQYKHRNCKITGEKGNLTWNFRENAVYFEYFNKKNQEKRKKIFKNPSSNLNKTYIDEVKYFLERVKNNKNTFNNLEKSLTVLKLILTNK